MTKTGRRAAAVVAAVIVAAAVGASVVSSDPSYAFLTGEGGAAWIRFPEPVYLGAHSPEPRTFSFRRRFELAEPRSGTLVVRGLKTVELLIDGRGMGRSTDPNGWKTAGRFGVSLPAGRHELLLRVTRADGPPALLSYSKELGVATGDGLWQASPDGTSWTPAGRVDDYAPPAESLAFGAPGASAMPALLALFAVLLAWLRRRPKLDAARIRLFLLAAWTLLGLRGLAVLPLACGFDIRAHMDYVRFLADFRALPKPADGWEMFQAPLYYGVAAALYTVLKRLVSEVWTWRLLRLIGLAAGALQLELAYRASRRLHPAREELVVAGTLLGGFLPASLYMSQFVGNEAFSGALAAAATVAAWRRESTSPTKASWREPAAVGALLGAAVLAKVSALLLVPPLLAYVWAAWPASPKKPAWQAAAATALVAAAVCGWWFVRNRLATGVFVTSGWDPTRGFDFWQDPGWRTPRDLLTFGWSLRAPVYSAPAGFWDSLWSTWWLDGFWGGTLVEAFSPRWNLPFVAAGAWLAFLPAAAALRGAAAALEDGPRARVLRFSAAVLALYGLALLGVFLRHPFFSSAKASYALGAVPAFVALALEGLDRFLAPSRTRAAVLAAWGVWAACAYAAYFRV